MLISSIFVVMVLGNLPLEPLRALCLEYLSVSVNGIARNPTYSGGLGDVIQLVSEL